MDLKLIIKVGKKGKLIETHIFNDIDKAHTFLRNLETEINSGRLIAEIQVSPTDVVKSFTTEEVVNELEDCDTLDDAIMFFKENR